MLCWSAATWTFTHCCMSRLVAAVYALKSLMSDPLVLASTLALVFACCQLSMVYWVREVLAGERDDEKKTQ